MQREVREHDPRVALTPVRGRSRVIRRLLTDAPQFPSRAGISSSDRLIKDRPSLSLVDPRV